jgi:site-specific recombinase XerC
MARLKLSVKERERYLNDPLVKRWVARLEKGSEKTATMWPSGLTAILHLTKKTPSEVVGMTKAQLIDLAEEYERVERKRGTAASTIASRLGFLRNFVQYSSDIQLPTGTFKVKGGSDSKEEAALTRDQLHATLSSANQREASVIVLMAQSGLRPGVIGNFEGTDGATIGDVRDLKVDGGVEWTASPAVIRVRRELSKAGHSYLSLIGSQAQDILGEYLKSRQRGGEQLTSKSPLIRTDGGRFPRSSEVGDYARNALKRAKVEARPYALRTTFVSRLSAAEADGLVTHEFRLFWSGHRGDTSATYAVNRGQLDDRMLDRMREAYRRCEPLLSTVHLPDQKEDRDTLLKVGLLRYVRGYSKEEAERLAADPNVDVRELILKKNSAATESGGEKPLPPKRDGEQRVIEAEATAAYLDAGWQFKSELNGTKAVVEWAGPIL